MRDGGRGWAEIGNLLFIYFLKLNIYINAQKSKGRVQKERGRKHLTNQSCDISPHTVICYG